MGDNEIKKYIKLHLGSILFISNDRPEMLITKGNQLLSYYEIYLN